MEPQTSIPWRVPLILTLAPAIGSVIGIVLHVEMVVFIAALASPGLSLTAGIILGRCTGSTAGGKFLFLLLWSAASFCVSLLLQFAGCSQLGPRFEG